MKIICLMEDTTRNPEYINEHGLSLYIETKTHKFLVDTGASQKTWENAERMGIDLSQIDAIFLSHGHYDHSGGILSFVEKYPDVKLYMRESASLDYYHKSKNTEKYIGIDKNILQFPGCILLDSDCEFDSEISVFSDVTGRRKWPNSNLILKRKEKEEFVQDTFDHEQYIVVSQDGKKVLISGCAHNGILNILDKYRSIYQTNPDIVISGFHMMKHAPYTEDEVKLIEDIAMELKNQNTVFYSGHCTGEAAFNLMKRIMGEKIHSMYSGKRIL